MSTAQDAFNYESLRDDVPHKSKRQGREFYEEKMERELSERRDAARKIYCESRRKFQYFNKQIKQITRINTKEDTGPEWFQELSNKQIEILEGLDDSMARDYDLGTSKTTRRSIKNLGVTTFIPHALVRDALITSKLYRTPFLQTIKDYVRQTNDTIISDQENDIKSDQTKKKNRGYTTEERILMSSILYLAYPSLLKKLDYCLTKSVPDKKLEYIKPKTKIKTPKYLFPYLEPLPTPVQPWTELENIKKHNMIVDRQILQETQKLEKQKELRDTEMIIERQTMLKMKITYPDHPLEKMFYNPPLRPEFIYENNIQTTPADVSEEEIHENTSNDKDQSSWMRWTPSPVDEQIENESMAVENPSSLYSWSSSVVAVKVPSTPPVIEPLLHSSSITRTTEFDSYLDDSDDESQVLPYDWLNLRTSETKLSMDSRSVSSENEESDDDLSQDIVLDGLFKIEKMPDEVDETPKVLKTADGGDDFPCLGAMKEFEMPAMNDNERTVWRTFRKRGDKSRPLSLRTSDGSMGTNITLAKIHRPTQNTVSMATLPRTPPQSMAADEQMTEDDEDDGGGEAGFVPLLKKLSLVNLSFKYGGDGYKTRSVTFPAAPSSTTTRWAASPTKYVRRTATAVRDEWIITDEDGSLDIDNFLDTIHKLPPWIELKVVLQVLSILGDPIAGFPELIKLNILRRWYEIRLNINRHLTSHMKNKLMDKSMAAWKMPRPKMTTIGPPKNPILGKNKLSKKITWNQVYDAKNKIMKTKKTYTTKLKHMAIANARELYPIAHNEYFDNQLTKYYKRTFYDYFPAKEDDCLFDYVTPAPSRNQNNAKIPN